MKTNTRNTLRTAVIALLIGTLFGAIGCGGDEPEQEDQRTESAGCGYEPYAGDDRVLRYVPTSGAGPEDLAANTTVELRISAIDSSEPIGSRAVSIVSDNDDSLKVMKLTENKVTLAVGAPGKATLTATIGDSTDRREFTVFEADEWVVRHLPAISTVDNVGLYWCFARDVENGMGLYDPRALEAGETVRFTEVARRSLSNGQNPSGATALLGYRDEPLVIESEATGLVVQELVRGDKGWFEYTIPADLAESALRVRSQQPFADDGLLLDVSGDVDAVGISIMGDISCNFEAGDSVEACHYQSLIDSPEGLPPVDVTLGVVRLRGAQCYGSSDACDVNLVIDTYRGMPSAYDVEVTDRTCLGDEPVRCTPGDCSLAVSQRVSLSFPQGPGLNVKLTHRGFTGEATLTGQIVRDEDSEQKSRR